MRILEDDHQASTHYPVLLVAIAALAMLTLSACQTLRQSVTEKYDNLASAGFLLRPANTPGREVMLRKLPIGQFVEFPQSGHVKYVYTDPLVCNCLYVGSQHSYIRYTKHMLRQSLAGEAQLTASMYTETGWKWSDWESG